MRLLVAVAFLCVAVSAKPHSHCDDPAKTIGLGSVAFFAENGLTRSAKKCFAPLVIKMASVVFTDNKCSNDFKTMVCPIILQGMKDKNLKIKKKWLKDANDKMNSILGEFYAGTTEEKMSMVCDLADCSENILKRLADLFESDPAVLECAETLFDEGYDKLEKYLESFEYEAEEGDLVDWDRAAEFLLGKMKGEGKANIMNWFEEEAETHIAEFFYNKDRICEAGCVSETAPYIDAFVKTADESECDFTDVCSCNEVLAMIKQTDFPCCVNKVVTFYEKKLEAIPQEKVDAYVYAADEIYEGASEQLYCMLDMYQSRKVDHCPVESA